MYDVLYVCMYMYMLCVHKFLYFLPFIMKVLTPRNTPREMIPTKRKPVPINFLADKENMDGMGVGRGSRTASKKAKLLIKVCYKE